MIKILVVDDNRTAAESTAMVLSMSGYSVECAFDGEQALRLFESFSPSIVLLDIGLPLVNGYEIAQRIRSMTILTQPKLIALTGYGQEADKAAAFAAGFDVHLTKPAEITLLMAAIKSNKIAN